MGTYGSPDLQSKEVEKLQKGMIYCKTCGKIIAKKAKQCPHCGAKNKNISAIGIIFMCIGILIIISAIGNSTSVPTSIDPITGESIKQDKFTLESHKGYSDGYFSYYVEGTIKNNTNKNYSYAQVTFNLYDKEGAQLGTAVDNINNFEPGGVWKYKAIGLTSDGIKVGSYKFIEITGW